MTKPDLLLASPLVESAAAQLAERFAIHSYWNAPDRDAILVEAAPRIRAIAVHGQSPAAVPIDAALMSRLPALEIVSNFGVGYNTIDTAWAAANGVVVTNTPDVLNAEVADVTIGLLISTLREFPQAERHLRAGKWLEKPYPLTRGSMHGRTVGILGLGRIGKQIARRLEPFDVTIVYHGRNRQEGVAYRYYADLMEMARDVDVLIVIAPASPQTRNIVNAEVLEALGPDGVLINMARGTLVDEEALIEALREGRILGAGLDVYLNEPSVPEGLLAVPNAVLLPHVASASHPTRRLMGQLVVDNLFAWLDGGAPPTPVPETPWPPAGRGDGAHRSAS